MKFKTPSRVRCLAAKYYARVVVCFLLFATVLSTLVYLELALWMHWHDTFVAPIIWLLIFMFLSDDLRAMFFPTIKSETHSLYEIGKSTPLHIGEITAALCRQRKMKMPRIFIHELEHPLALQPGAAHSSFLYPNSMSISRMFALLLPQPLMRALIAHTLRHFDTCINLYPRIMRILIRLSDLMLLTFAINFLFVAWLRQGEPLLAVGIGLGALLILALHGRFSRYLLGVVSRSREHYADVLAAADTGDHRALVYLLCWLDDFAETCDKVLHDCAMRQQNMREHLQQLTASVQVRRREIRPLRRRILRWPWIGCKIAFSALYHLLLLLMLLPLPLLDWSWREFQSRPKAKDRKAVLDAIFGPSKPLECVSFELPDDDDEFPSGGSILNIVD